MSQQLTLLIMTLLFWVAVVVADKQPAEFAVQEMRNPAIWEKKLVGGRKIVVERAYVYPSTTKPTQLLGNRLQYAFFLADEKKPEQRQLLWVRDGWLASTGTPYPSPGIEMLDAHLMADGELVVLFNQYGLSFGFKIATRIHEGDVVANVVPSDRLFQARVPSDDGLTLGYTLKSGSIQVDGDHKLIMNCVSHDGTKYRRVLTKRADHTQTWTTLGNDQKNAPDVAGNKK